MEERSTGTAAGVVLAAGRSARMGRPKALLELEGGTFLARCIRTLRNGGCAPVVVVVGAAAGDVAEEAEGAGAVVVVNERGDSEQVDSLRLGLAALPDSAGAAVVLPVDHPLVRAATVAALVDAWHVRPEAIVRPGHQGTPGHPTLFPRHVWASLSGELPRGARSLVEDREHPTEEVAVDDMGVVVDVDTPESYARWVEGR